MEPDFNLTDEEQQERYQRALQRRLALCGSRTYPSVYARQDILDQFRCNTCFKGHEFCRCGEGIDISDKEDGI